MGDGRYPKDLTVTPPPHPISLSKRGTKAQDAYLEKLFETVRKVAICVNASAEHTKQIPSINEKVNKTSLKVVQLDTKLEEMGKRVERIDTKVDGGHDCFQVENITELKESLLRTDLKLTEGNTVGVRNAASLKSLKEVQAATKSDVEDIKKSPRRMFYGLLGVILAIAGAGSSAVWFLAALQKDVEFERTQRVEQFKRIESNIKAVGVQVDSAPIKIGLKALERAVKSSNGHEEAYNSLCVDMRNYEKRFVRETLIKRGRVMPLSCVE
jgi:hypothetical protein